jgi:biopolymer transport protein ExbD
MASGSKKRGFVQPQGQTNSDINVTPLIDVVLVLLIIFMVVTPLMEKDLEVKVPQTEAMAEPEDVPDTQVVVGLSPEGKLTINNEPISEEEYVPKLKRMMAAKAATDRPVFFMPDDRANYGALVAALDGAKAAGAETLGMTTDLPESPPSSVGPPVP